MSMIPPEINLLRRWYRRVGVVRFRAAAHEVRCGECRVTWRSWFQRIVGNPKGMTP